MGQRSKDSAWQKGKDRHSGAAQAPASAMSEPPQAQPGASCEAKREVSDPHEVEGALHKEGLSHSDGVLKRAYNLVWYDCGHPWHVPGVGHTSEWLLRIHWTRESAEACRKVGGVRTAA